MLKPVLLVRKYTLLLVVFMYLYSCIWGLWKRGWKDSCKKTYAAAGCIYVFVFVYLSIKKRMKMQLWGNICRPPPAAAGCIYSNILNLDLSEEFKFNFCLDQTFYNLLFSSSSASKLIKLSTQTDWLLMTKLSQRFKSEKRDPFRGAWKADLNSTLSLELVW